MNSGTKKMNTKGKMQEAVWMAVLLTIWEHTSIGGKLLHIIFLLINEKIILQPCNMDTCSLAWILFQTFSKTSLLRVTGPWLGFKIIYRLTVMDIWIRTTCNVRCMLISELLWQVHSTSCSGWSLPDFKGPPQNCTRSSKARVNPQSCSISL